MKRLDKMHRGKLSIPVLGELLLYILKELKDKKEQYILLDLILGLVKEREIKIVSVENVEETIMKIKVIDSRIEPMDRLNLACAAADGADTFVTMDKNLVNNEKLEKELNIKIIHPKEVPLS